MSLECDIDKQDQDLLALLICGVGAAESTKALLLGIYSQAWVPQRISIL